MSYNNQYPSIKTYTYVGIYNYMFCILENHVYMQIIKVSDFY